MGYFKETQIDPSMTPERYAHCYDRPTTTTPAPCVTTEAGRATKECTTMTTPSLPHTTPELLIAASMLVRLAHPTNASLHRALDKAQERLSSYPWRLYDGHLEITSASHPNEVHHCDDTYCTCKTTRGICWHIASWHILSAIAGAGGLVSPALPLPDMEAMDDSYEPYGNFLDYVPQPARSITPVAGSRLAQAQSAADAYFS